MALRIEDYALIGNCSTGALVGRNGSIDWLALPRFDSASCFGALLGDDDHGRWLLAPDDPAATCTREYDSNSLILITHWHTTTGDVDVIDFMPVRDERCDVVRRVVGISGTVDMHDELRIRCGYAASVPWVRQITSERPSALVAVAGPDALVFRGATRHPHGRAHHSAFRVHAGEHVNLTMTWFPSYSATPAPVNVDDELTHTRNWWWGWASRCDHNGPYHDNVMRSLLLLRALTHRQTGGIVAAATTSLPEIIGGERNWDYRYVWLRDASLTIDVLVTHGYVDLVSHWRDWLLRAIAGDPADVQIVYGLSGERDLHERELTTLPGYRNSGPVRVGNGAWNQFQADVIGEVMFALDRGRAAGVSETHFSWSLQRSLVSYLEKNWRKPDNGIWEIRGEPQHFTHSRVLVWAAFDCAIRGVEVYGLEGPVAQWRKLRDEIRADIEQNGFDTQKNTYVQYFGTSEVDSSLLVLPQVGYCAYDDPRMLGTVSAIEQELMPNSLVMRYRTEDGVDGLPTGENPFLPCSFWLVEQYARSGRISDARSLMDRLVTLSNDVGMLSEEYDVSADTQVGNVPQALSHLALIRGADALRGVL